MILNKPHSVLIYLKWFLTYPLLAVRMFFFYSAVIDEDEPVVDQSIVQEVVEASQRSFSQELCKFSSVNIHTRTKKTLSHAISFPQSASPLISTQKTQWLWVIQNREPGISGSGLIVCMC